MSLTNEIVEAIVLARVEEYGAYAGKIGCLLCLPMRRAAERLVDQGRLRSLGIIDGKQVWVKAEDEK